MISNTETGSKIKFYPTWVRDILAFMAATYGSLWTPHVATQEMAEVVKALWFNSLKDFSPQEIEIGILECGKKFPYPPKIAEFLIMLKEIRRQKSDDEHFRILDEKRLLNDHSERIESIDALRAKAEMWANLGFHQRAQEKLDEINAREAK